VPFGVMVLVDEIEPTSVPGVIMLALSLLAIWLVYRWRRPDLGMLAAFAAVVTILTAALFGRILFVELEAELFGVAALGVIVCAQVWAFTRWLLAWRRDHGHDADPHQEPTR
jgi:hypothetical protein